MAVKSSRVVFEVLREISAADEPLGAIEVARSLSAPITTVARALNTLEAAGYVLRYNSSAKYVIGKSGQRLSYAFMASFPVRDLALPYLQRLTLLSGHSSSLFIRLGWYSLRIALISGTNSVVNVGAIGESRPLTIGAPSLAMLAQLPDEDVSRAVKKHGNGTATQLRETCERIRIQGYAFQASALESGGHDLAFPLSTPNRAMLSSVALEGIMVSAESSRDQIDLARQVVSPLQDIIATDSSMLLSPYEHVDPDQISLRRGGG